MRTGAATCAVSVLALVLAGCDGGSATPARSHASYDAPVRPSAGASSGAARADAGDDQIDHRKDPVPTVEGKPLWAANRRYTAEENAEYQFQHRGADFDAKSVQDYVTKVHAFVDAPPERVKTFVRRNGDKLLYDPKRNIFAVVTKDGAPRTMFKPQDGAAYWTQQTSADETSSYSHGSRSYHHRSSGDGGDSGADG